jgi:hypothetical protein
VEGRSVARTESSGLQTPHLDPEKVAYWYFRLNGFLQIENFIIHPGRRGGQRTDADLLAVRFPYRTEFLFEAAPPMLDDAKTLQLSPELIDVVIAEVKTNDPCRLNGPWTDKDDENVNRVLAAIGCMPQAQIQEVAAAIYGAGYYSANDRRIRLVAIGRESSQTLAQQFPLVTQLIWKDMLEFIWHRFHMYRRQKRDVHQWDSQGLLLKEVANESHDADQFLVRVLGLMNVRSY